MGKAGEPRCKSVNRSGVFLPGSGPGWENRRMILEAGERLVLATEESRVKCVNQPGHTIQVEPLESRAHVTGRELIVTKPLWLPAPGSRDVKQLQADGFEELRS